MKRAKAGLHQIGQGFAQILLSDAGPHRAGHPGERIDCDAFQWTSSLAACAAAPEPIAMLKIKDNYIFGDGAVMARE